MGITKIQTLSQSVAAYLQLPGGWYCNNAGWIAGAERTLLVDTCATEGRSRRLLDAAQAASPGAPVSLALTHAHGDHAHGARLVADQGGVVMASPEAADEIKAGPHTYPQVNRV